MRRTPSSPAPAPSSTPPQPLAYRVSAGSLFVDGRQLVDGPEFPAEYKAGATAARDYLGELRKNTQPDWTFVSPAVEMHPSIRTGRTGGYRLSTDSPVADATGRSVHSVEDLAVAVLDEVERPQFSRRRFTAAYSGRGRRVPTTPPSLAARARRAGRRRTAGGAAPDGATTT